MVQGAHELYAELVEQATDRSLEQEELAAMSAYSMAATVDFGTDAKQELLELRSENARLRLLTLLFRAAIKQMELSRACAGSRALQRQGPLLLRGHASSGPLRIGTTV